MRNETEITAYPLCWPQGQRRTPVHKITNAPFKMPDEKAKRELVAEIRRLGGRGIIISSNVPVRNDGMPYADAARRRIDDAGVAVYFEYNGSQKCFACDRWQRPSENIRAIGLSIAALRGIERWGSSDMVERAFTGYTALPPPMVTEPPRRNWREVLGCQHSTNENMLWVKTRYNDMAKELHPDMQTGDHNKMAELNRAYEEAKREIGE